MVLLKRIALAAVMSLLSEGAIAGTPVPAKPQQPAPHEAPKPAAQIAVAEPAD